MTKKRNRRGRADGLPADVDRTDALYKASPASDPSAVSTPEHAAVVSGSGKMDQSTIYDGESVFVEQLLPAAHARLMTIAEDAPLHEAAHLLCTGADLVVVCGTSGTMAGVITKSDVVTHIGECQGTVCSIAAASVMSSDVLWCAPHDLVQDTWSKMKARDLKNIPVVDADGRPVGVLNARDVLGILLQEVKGEESQLRDYVMGVGYR